jgi:hypothetical protein
MPLSYTDLIALRTQWHTKPLANIIVMTFNFMGIGSKLT